MTSGQVKASLLTKNRLTAKQEAFVLNLFKGLTQHDAYINVYHPNSSASVIDVDASHLAHNPKVILRLRELRDALNQPDIANVEERQKRLTKFLRANLVDFNQNDEPYLDKSIPNHEAAKEYSVSTTYNKMGDTIVKKSIKLIDPISAIAELNKMEHIYEAGNSDRPINVVFVIGKGYSQGNATMATTISEKSMPEGLEGETGNLLPSEDKGA